MYRWLTGYLARLGKGSDNAAGSQPIEYETVYEQLYRQGYHSDLNFSNAKDLVAWVLENLQFSSVLDVGCSSGWALEKFSEAGKQVAGLDPSPTAIEYCRGRGIDAVTGCAHQLPFTEGQFELVLSTDCLEHLNIQHVAGAIREMHRVASRFLALKICPHVDQGEWKQVVGHDLHLTVKPIRWWVTEFLKPGGKVVHFDNRDTFVIRLN